MKWEALTTTSKSILLGAGSCGQAFAKLTPRNIWCWLRSTRLSLKLVHVGHELNFAWIEMEARHESMGGVESLQGVL